MVSATPPPPPPKIRDTWVRWEINGGFYYPQTVTVPTPADEPYFIEDECDVFSNENPDENDSASVSKSEIQDEEEEIKTFYDEDSGYDSY